MAKKIKGMIVFAVMGMAFLGYQLYINSIDTKYAIRFSEVFRTYDIYAIDSFLSQETLLIYNGKRANYKELRENVIAAIQERKYIFDFGASYGYGNDTFINDIQDIKIYLFGEFNGNSFGECILKMKLRREGMFTFFVESIECDEPIFAYLFYGETIDK